jgi:anthranilate synthase component 1
MSKGDYCEIVEQAKEYILQGDIFQVVLSQRFNFDLNANPFDVYRVLRQINPSPYMYFVKNREVTLVGCSPEPLIQLRGKTVTSRPIAGTRKRGSSQAEDKALADSLKEDPKELAEHIMLVDLARNDLGRICEFGTLQVDELKTLERYSHVMHLTSQVSGKLGNAYEPIDVIKAAFPAGTVSGAPKVRAMQIIDELEKSKRGPYAGIVGYLDFNGNLDNAIAIRTMVITPQGASVQAGAGIVADSDPIAEYDECWAKAKALISAVKPAEEMTRVRNNGSY